VCGQRGEKGGLMMSKGARKKRWRYKRLDGGELGIVCLSLFSGVPW